MPSLHSLFQKTLRLFLDAVGRLSGRFFETPAPCFSTMTIGETTLQAANVFFLKCFDALLSRIPLPYRLGGDLGAVAIGHFHHRLLPAQIYGAWRPRGGNHSSR